MSLEEEQNKKLAELREWFQDHHADTDEATISKAVAYGGADMRIMGAAMAELAASPSWSPTDSQSEEMALGFYLLGKVSRLFGAWARGESPDIDSWLDSEVYAQMAQKIITTGRWT